MIGVLIFVAVLTAWGLYGGARDWINERREHAQRNADLDRSAEAFAVAETQRKAQLRREIDAQVRWARDEQLAKEAAR